jgi:diamine N-acetyltransferase
MKFEVITDENEAFVDTISPGEQAKFWVHYNWYWKEKSRTLQDIEARLIYVEQQEIPIGFIAYGQYYEDEESTRPLKGFYEIIHLVIDVCHQHQGYGRMATVMAIDYLRTRPDCHHILIAHHPNNIVARHLYRSLGFQEWGRNYDGDPILCLLLQP